MEQSAFPSNGAKAMNNPNGVNGANGVHRHDEMDLLSLVTAVAQHRRMILRNVALAFLVFMVAAFLWPRSYVAKTSILPPDSVEPDGLSLLLNNTPFAGLALPRARTSSDLFAEILASRSVGEGVLHHPVTIDSDTTSLLEYWQNPLLTKALQRLYRRTTISTTEQGIILIETEMDHPELAAQIANTFVSELDRVNQEKSISRAKNSRVYIEQQLQITQAKLNSAADSLRLFQERHHAVALPEQMRAAIDGVAEVKGTLVAKQVQLDVMQQSMRASNPVIVQMQAEVRELRKQYDNMQYGTGEKGQKDYFPAFAEVPQIGQQLAGLMREVKVQETIWELLNQQYYQAKIQEARDTPTVQVLDVAVPPEQHAKPKRLLMVLLGTTVVFILSFVASVIIYHAGAAPRDSAEWEKWRGLVGAIHNDVQHLRQRFVRKKENA
jgi:uncharacterized protein involved in exopolysaccharide biosynthesis